MLLAWEWLVPKPAKPPPARRRAATPSAAASPPRLPRTLRPSTAAHGSRRAAASRPRASAEESVRIGNGVFEATFSNRGGSADLVRAREVLRRQKQPLELVRALPPELPRPLALDFGEDAALTKTVSNALFVVERPSDRVVRLRYADAAIAIEKEIRISDGYLFDVKVSVSGPAVRRCSSAPACAIRPRPSASRAT